MDKAFFESFDERRAGFAARAGYPAEEVRAHVILGNGRAYALEAVVEAADAWLHLDVREIDDDTLRSIMLPYYQIHHLVFLRERARGGTGFNLG